MPDQRITLLELAGMSLVPPSMLRNMIRNGTLAESEPRPAEGDWTLLREPALSILNTHSKP